MTTVGRVVVAVLGLIVVFAGLMLWSLEDEYGSGLNYSISNSAGGKWAVSELDGHNQTVAIVFEGSLEAATAFTEERRSAGESFLIPALVMVAGVIMVVVAIGAPLWGRIRRRDGTVRPD